MGVADEGAGFEGVACSVRRTAKPHKGFGRRSYRNQQKYLVPPRFNQLDPALSTADKQLRLTYLSPD